MSFALAGGPGFCNAVRRTLLSDVEAWAPHEVDVRVNTSCQTDEFLAHRIGLVPFRRVGHGDTLELRVAGPCVCTAGMLTGPAFTPVYPDVELMKLGHGQALDLTVHLNEKPASTHSRYAMCAAVGMRREDAGSHALTFEVLDGRRPKDVLHEALDALDARVQRALHALAHQPAVPLKSMC
jgi:hypothetical protein